MSQADRGDDEGYAAETVPLEIRAALYDEGCLIYDDELLVCDDDELLVCDDVWAWDFLGDGRTSPGVAGSDSQVSR